MNLKDFDIEGAALLIEMDGSDCELLARICHAAYDAGACNDNRIADMALLFSLATVTCGIYGHTNIDKRSQGRLLDRLERSKRSLDE